MEIITKSIEQKRLEFLEETVKFYNFDNRSVKVNINGNTSGCLYSPIKGKSEGCAIGRHIPDKKLCKELDKQKQFSGVGFDSIFLQLPSELQELGQDFLKTIQIMHDTRWFWNSEGLSEFGSFRVEEIKEQFNLNDLS